MEIDTTTLYYIEYFGAHECNSMVYNMVFRNDNTHMNGKTYEDWVTLESHDGHSRIAIGALGESLKLHLWGQVSITLTPNGCNIHILDDEWIQMCILNRKTCYFHYLKFI